MNNLLAQAAATPLADSTTRLIPLTQGKFAIVDAADFDWLNQWEWFANCQRGIWYAERNTSVKEGGRVKIRMHTQIVQLTKGVEVDHRDGDGLNNQRSNLRSATHQQNLCNKRAQSNNKSGYKGVCWEKRCGKWRAEITSFGRRIHLGYFDNKELAASAYDASAKKYHGEFARFNFPTS